MSNLLNSRKSLMTLTSATALVVLLTGCQSSANGSRSAPDSAAGTAAPAPGDATKAPDTSVGSAKPSNVKASSPEDEGTSTAQRTPAAQSTSSPLCDTEQLTLEPLESVGAAEEQGSAFLTLTNTSSSSCHTGGFVGLRLLAADGSEVPTKVQRTTTDGPDGPAEPSVALTLAPGKSAWARLRWDDGFGKADSHYCPTPPAELKVTPPDSYSQLQTEWLNGAGCVPHAISVTPLRDHD